MAKCQVVDSGSTTVSDNFIFSFQTTAGTAQRVHDDTKKVGFVYRIAGFCVGNTIRIICDGGVGGFSPLNLVGAVEVAGKGIFSLFAGGSDVEALVWVVL
eukprot:CAMPEP_0197267562 /NCGR_PEP_ID=MMETSP1432-20130617/3659_1 /TAXON_ID=44447 /ORGANISM="Pseudo-nitzschia delicatissima, Strain UNC1205" /LENGTH=99 /DNA_ID=CAMNT_0042732525 /DNA_START=589 /DNA_END=884 /DNA_ORIENTATION=+